MLKIYICFFAFVLCYVQCLPTEAISQSSATQQTLHLNVKNSSEATNYHLTPIIDELGNIDEEVNEELDAILPYINFLFDLFSQGSDSDENDCADSMVIQLVPDTPFEKKEADIHNATEKSETKPI